MIGDQGYADAEAAATQAAATLCRSGIGPAESLTKSAAWNGVIVNSRHKSNYEVTCIYCDHSFKGSAARVRTHFVGERNCGVKRCSAADSIPENFIITLKTEQQQSVNESNQRVKRRKLNALQNQTTLPAMSSGKTVRNLITEFFLAEGIPFVKVESPYFRKMASALSTRGKGVPIPVRQTLAGTLTDEKYSEVANAVASATLDRPPCSLICDGWKNTAGDPVMAYLQAWSDFSVYRASYNTKGDRRTGQVVCDQAVTVAAEIGAENICQFVTDSGSDCKAARKQFCDLPEYSHVLNSACSCHCLDLLCEDVFKKIDKAKSSKEKGDMMVAYVRNHNVLRGEFHDHSGVELLSPVETRFGTTVIELDRLNDFKTDISVTFHGSKADELYRTLQKPAEKDKFKLVRSYVDDMNVWEDFTYTLRLTLPILHLIRICDNSDHEAPAFVYSMMLNLQQYYKHDPGLAADSHLLQELLANRWKMMHSPLHDVGYLLNPPSLRNEPWGDPGVMKGFRELVEKWARLIKIHTSDTPSSIRDRASAELERYIAIVGDIAKNFVDRIYTPQDIDGMLTTWALPKRSRDTQQVEPKKTNTVKSFWRLYGSETPTLQKLALIAMSQPVSQSAAEQSFSAYKNVMPPSRNALSPDTQFKCMFVYYNIRKLNSLRGL